MRHMTMRGLRLALPLLAVVSVGGCQTGTGTGATGAGAGAATSTGFRAHPASRAAVTAIIAN